MKKTGIFIAIVFLLGGITYAVWYALLTPERIKNPISLSPRITPSEMPKGQPSPTVSIGDRTYAYASFLVSDPTRLFLIANFTKKDLSGDIQAAHACTAGINGGFYDADYEPLGGFVSEGNTYKSPVKNRLIDGFVWVKEDRVGIGLETPEGARISLQTGPLLVMDGNKTTIRIQNDEFTRRSLAFLTNSGTLGFMTLYDPEAVYNGPKLGDLPEIITQLNATRGMNIAQAVNLDGGNASAIHAPAANLSELSLVGSYFCLKNK